jgi:hypothetical protein
LSDIPDVAAAAAVVAASASVAAETLIGTAIQMESTAKNAQRLTMIAFLRFLPFYTLMIHGRKRSAVTKSGSIKISAMLMI